MCGSLRIFVSNTFRFKGLFKMLEIFKFAYMTITIYLVVGVYKTK